MSPIAIEPGNKDAAQDRYGHITNIAYKTNHGHNCARNKLSLPAVPYSFSFNYVKLLDCFLFQTVSLDNSVPGINLPRDHLGHPNGMLFPEILLGTDATITLITHWQAA